jgi:hypothetical protein
MQACIVVALALSLPCQVKDTEDGPVPKSKWKSDYTEKTWGLQLKTVKYTTSQQPAEIKVVLEFTKDLQADELKALKEAFTRKEGGLEFCFFDEDGVIFIKATSMDYGVAGDLSGVKGDAIRCVIGLPKNSPLLFLNSPEASKKVSKVELRPAQPK